MRQFIIAMMMLTLTSGAYAGPIVDQLESATGAEAVSTDIQVPSRPADIKATSFCQDNPMAPGCPKFCHTSGWGHPSCPPPLYCNTNPNGYGCPKMVGAAEEKGLAGVTDEAEAKSICRKHKMRPGCPMYCQMSPWHQACGYVPLYCKTNPNGYRCPKSVGAAEEKGMEDVTDEAEAKSICRKHKMRPGCPMFCQVNIWHKSCGHVPAYCHTNPNGYRCPKSVSAGEEKGLANVTDEAEAKSICRKHKMRPGCPLFCQMNKWHKSCGHVPAYCHTNPNGYRCPKAAGAGEEKGIKNAANGEEEKGWLDASYCRKHKMRPGCPMFCQMQPLHKSCNHKPAYCHTNPNGHGCK